HHTVVRYEFEQSIPEQHGVRGGLLGNRCLGPAARPARLRSGELRGGRVRLLFCTAVIGGNHGQELVSGHRDSSTPRTHGTKRHHIYEAAGVGKSETSC